MKTIIFTLFLVLILTPLSAFSFCGFYVGGSGDLYSDATSVILMRHGTRTTLSMQNDYAGPAKDFAMVIPVPQVLEKEDVKTLNPSIFEKVDTLAAPRLVEYWEEDPCYRRPRRKHRLRKRKKSISNILEKPSKSGVVVKARFNVKEYQIVILSAKDSTGLETWLKDNKYNIPQKAAKYFQPYIQSGMYFFVAKVDIDKVQKIPGGGYRLSPIQFTYESDDFTLPIRLGLINSRGSQDLIIHILAEGQRYEAANYPSVMIPTNINLKASAKEKFGVFYTSMFNAVMKATPKAVVTEYSWQAKNCDPCPRTPLNVNDIRVLAGDKLTDANLNDFVLTRLHTRYKAGKVGEDLVFKKAPPIIGGRESSGKRVKSAAYNNFQGRYIIRHRWKGKVSCKHPRYKRWSGSPKLTTSTKKSVYVKNKKYAYRRLSKGKIRLKSKLKK